MLDLQQMARTIGQLQTAAGSHPSADAAAPAASHEPANIDALMAALKAEERAISRRPNLIETGLGLLGDLLGKRL
jgi:hypothetical protein